MKWRSKETKNSSLVGVRVDPVRTRRRGPVSGNRPAAKYLHGRRQDARDPARARARGSDGDDRPSAVRGGAAEMVHAGHQGPGQVGGIVTAGDSARVLA